MKPNTIDRYGNLIYRDISEPCYPGEIALSEGLSVKDKVVFLACFVIPFVVFLF